MSHGYLNPGELSGYDIIVTTYHVLQQDLSHAILKFGKLSLNTTLRYALCEHELVWGPDSGLDSRRPARSLFDGNAADVNCALGFPAKIRNGSTLTCVTAYTGRFGVEVICVAGPDGQFPQLCISSRHK